MNDKITLTDKQINELIFRLGNTEFDETTTDHVVNVLEEESDRIM